MSSFQQSKWSYFTKKQKKQIAKNQNLAWTSSNTFSWLKKSKTKMTGSVLCTEPKAQNGPAKFINKLQNAVRGVMIKL